jgi:hypothetical protein
MNPAASATLSTKPISGGGLLLHRHCIPLSRPAVAYFRADVLKYIERLESDWEIVFMGADNIEGDLSDSGKRDAQESK